MNRVVLAAVTGALLVAPSLGAQSGLRATDGYAASIGIGAGSATLTCSTCSRGQQVAPSLTARLGRAVSTSVVIAAEASGWRKEFKSGADHGTTTLAFANLVAQWYPAESGLFFKAGGGMSWIRSDNEIAGFGNADAHRSGPGAVLGVGLDIGSKGLFALTPYADVNFGPEGNASSTIGTTPRLGGRLLQAGVAVSWR